MMGSCSQTVAVSVVDGIGVLVGVGVGSGVGIAVFVGVFSGVWVAVAVAVGVQAVATSSKTKPMKIIERVRFLTLFSLPLP